MQVEFKTTVAGNDGKLCVGNTSVRVPLLNHDSAPLWKEHPLGSGIDGVAVDVTGHLPEKLFNVCTNECGLQSNYQPNVGDDCFVVGFPKGLSGQGGMPLWKRASIATEPEFDQGKQPIFLIDTATRKGMSGSPVIVRHSGIWNPSGKIADDSIMGTIFNIIGIYSGRIEDDEMGVQIGREGLSR